MRKLRHDTLPPAEFYTELRSVVRRLGELATFLNRPLPKCAEDIEHLSDQEIMDLYTTSRGSLELIEKQWEIEADELIAQALATDSVFPASRDPS